MVMDITCCSNCNLYTNQSPLLDKVSSADIMWVGLSAKRVDNVCLDTPLSKNTNSGKLIQKIESGIKGFSFLKSNLVKCLPLDKSNKLRYPTIEEMNSCYRNLLYEVGIVKPKIIFLLGQRVSSYVLKEMNVAHSNVKGSYIYDHYKIRDKNYIPVHHPSYIYIYKKSEMDNYVLKIQKLIQGIMSNKDRLR